MRAQIPIKPTTIPAYAVARGGESNCQTTLLQPLWDLAEHSDSLVAGFVGRFEAQAKEFEIPRVIFMGPKGGGETIRLGIFATFHGDESDGAQSVVEFFRAIEESPELARGFHLYGYPICNPSGFAARARDNFTGADLTREFWQKSAQPEVYYLEREMGVHNFQGVITLHVSRNSTGFFGLSRSSLIQSALVEPAIGAARRFMPGSSEKEAQRNDIPSSFLTITDELRTLPFEVNLGVPGLLPEPTRVHGSVAALKTILETYRAFIAQRQNI